MFEFPYSMRSSRQIATVYEYGYAEGSSKPTHDNPEGPPLILRSCRKLPPS